VGSALRPEPLIEVTADEVGAKAAGGPVQAVAKRTAETAMTTAATAQ
jgi:hypothetical protein